MRTPHRLQMEARCRVARTGIFLNIVAIRTFIDGSFVCFDAPKTEQGGCHILNHAKKIKKLPMLPLFCRGSSHCVGIRFEAKAGENCSSWIKFVHSCGCNCKTFLNGS